MDLKIQDKDFPLPKSALSIAGAAAGGSAGIQADLKTFQELGVYGMSVITAIVGRHPDTEKNVHPIDVESIEAQLHTAFAKNVDGIKTGMLFSKKVINTVAHFLGRRKMQYLVVDPVMVGKLGSKLLHDDAIEAMRSEIVPLAEIVTPNMHEASLLLDERPINHIDDMVQAAKDIHHQGVQWVLVKGGELKGPAVDVLFDGKETTFFQAERIPTKNTSGAGCTYSSAIAAYLAKGMTIAKAVEKAKQFVTTAIAYSFSYNTKPGPVNHIAPHNYDAYIKVKKYKEG